MSETKTYEGSCHCGKVRYTVETDLARVIECNCSICRRTGTLLTFVPAAQFKLLSGGDAVQDYQFNRHMIHHFFCTTCGVRSYCGAALPDGKDMRAINVRCLHGVDVKTLTITQYDGAAL